MDVTIENTTRAVRDGYDFVYNLIDEKGYGYETEPMVDDAKPEPSGQIPPGGKLSGEIAYDLGTKPVAGTFTFSVVDSMVPDAPPAIYQFEVEWS